VIGWLCRALAKPASQFSCPPGLEDRSIPSPSLLRILHAQVPRERVFTARPPANAAPSRARDRPAADCGIASYPARSPPRRRLPRPLCVLSRQQTFSRCGLSTTVLSPHRLDIQKLTLCQAIELHRVAEAVYRTLCVSASLALPPTTPHYALLPWAGCEHSHA
jgi:hypothetical protein